MGQHFISEQYELLNGHFFIINDRGKLASDILNFASLKISPWIFFNRPFRVDLKDICFFNFFFDILTEILVK